MSKLLNVDAWYLIFIVTTAKLPPKEVEERDKNAAQSLGWPFEKFDHEPSWTFHVKEKRRNGYPFTVLERKMDTTSFLVLFWFWSDRFHSLIDWFDLILFDSGSICNFRVFLNIGRFDRRENGLQCARSGWRTRKDAARTTLWPMRKSERLSTTFGKSKSDIEFLTLKKTIGGSLTNTIRSSEPVLR